MQQEADLCSQAVLDVARTATGFMPDGEGLALMTAAREIVATDHLPSVVVEVGAYCGRSTLYLAAGVVSSSAVRSGVVSSGAAAPGGWPTDGPALAPPAIFSVDHHHGSEENQVGWEHHDSSLVDPSTGRLETLGTWRSNTVRAGVEDLVVGVVGDSQLVAAHWSSPIGLLFIDGGHGDEPAWADYRGWAPHVHPGGLLAIHDVFPDPADGGRPPYELYCHALSSGAFTERHDLGTGSLRVLERTGPGT
jgi:predicted O-methyltransferase YrrM